jgi:signal transduction histidine kinase
VYGSLSESYAGAGKMQEAYQNLLLSNQYRDSVSRDEQLKVIEETKAIYETEKKEQQIALQQAELSQQQARLNQTYIVIGFLVITVIFIIIIFVLVRSRLKRKQQLLQKEKELSVREAYIEASIQSQENERKRFARDLHDGLGQLISSLRMILHPVHKNMGIEERMIVNEKAETLLNDMHHEIRSIAFNLMPHTLIQYGLVPALKEMAERMNHSGAVVIRIDSFHVPDRLTELQEISLYRVVQEWVNNVIKYAQPSVIEVQLVGHDHEISVTIEDNGKGFDPSVLEKSEGNGWKNIQSRLNLLDGFYDIDSQPGKNGTTLTLRIPFVTSVDTRSLNTLEIETQS